MQESKPAVLSVQRKPSTLRKLPLWQACLYPLVLATVGIYTWSKDRFASNLPRRSYGSFQFKPETQRIGEPVRVLVVDDNIFHQEVSHRLLQKSGFIADFAKNGIEAVSACRSKSYDLVLMDILMPEMSGLKASEQIRKESLSRHVRIVAVTAQESIDPSEIRQSGMDGVIKKPLIIRELQKELRVSSAKRLKAS